MTIVQQLNYLKTCSIQAFFVDNIGNDQDSV
jgi:hypothetical protein